MRAKALDMVISYLRREIPKMQPHARLFKELKRELSAIGRWKNAPRGKPTASNFKGKDRPEVEP